MAEYITRGFTRHELWSAGLVDECPVTRKSCRFSPCTAAQDVDCCKDCMLCGHPCGIARKAVGRNE